MIALYLIASMTKNVSKLWPDEIPIIEGEGPSKSSEVPTPKQFGKETDRLEYIKKFESDSIVKSDLYFATKFAEVLDFRHVSFLDRAEGWIGNKVAKLLESRVELILPASRFSRISPTVAVDSDHFRICKNPEGHDFILDLTPARRDGVKVIDVGQTLMRKEDALELGKLLLYIIETLVFNLSTSTAKALLVKIQEKHGIPQNAVQVLSPEATTSQRQPVAEMEVEKVRSYIDELAAKFSRPAGAGFSSLRKLFLKLFLPSPEHQFAFALEDAIDLHRSSTLRSSSYPVYLVQRPIDQLRHAPDFLAGYWSRHYALVIDGHWYQLYKNPEDKRLWLDCRPFEQNWPVYGKLVAMTRIKHEDRLDLGESCFM